ncbi:hypothetical protein MNEG_12214 [Monoraphidium neglectum]|uniref:PhoD-like phosphatase domain-containing protein n=1 Tax=Monoraphidium neglectum TaxID=145388 RepID=A0A0D2KIW9_9CHLO|nr:hypothetical protein MNEG_12214 [Monoraphidium neglectum]KIY95748.1 hypothetical protein MNEG_12214 [Monoraphidium neglectum]|eukprot:XP_013894768.1 hypothetical protein MNEG_12214 [Monoraphidium neglectum]
MSEPPGSGVRATEPVNGSGRDAGPGQPTSAEIGGAPAADSREPSGSSGNQPPRRQHDLLDRAPIPRNTCGCGEARAPASLGPFLRCGGWRPPPELAGPGANGGDSPAATPLGPASGEGGDAPYGWWTGSALFVSKDGWSEADPDGRAATPTPPPPPRLLWRDAAARGAGADRGGGGGRGGGVGQRLRAKGEAEGRQLDEWGGWKFWRFDLEIPVAWRERRISYEIRAADAAAHRGGGRAGGGVLARLVGRGGGDSGSDCGGGGGEPDSGKGSGDAEELAFYIAGADQPWRWGFYSCAGFSNDVPLEDHDKKHGGFGLLVGSGDQLYNDDVFTTPSLKEVPQVMTWDDHDLFDGWGSYPERVQTCPVFKGIYAAARRFYLLFQLHTTHALARTHQYFGGRGYSQLLLLGPRVALALPDQRAERTTQQVGQTVNNTATPAPMRARGGTSGRAVATEDGGWRRRPGRDGEGALAPRLKAGRGRRRGSLRALPQIIGIDTYFELFMRLYQLPAGVRHLVVVTTVPLVYPHLTTSQKVLEVCHRLSNIPAIFRVLKATGLTHQVYSHFDEPDLLDDLKISDHGSQSGRSVFG